jgi:hypothetical protein
VFVYVSIRVVCVNKRVKNKNDPFSRILYYILAMLILKCYSKTYPRFHEQLWPMTGHPANRCVYQKSISGKANTSIPKMVPYNSVKMNKDDKVCCCLAQRNLGFVS